MAAAVVMMLLGLIILMCAWISSILLTPPADKITARASMAEVAPIVPTLIPSEDEAITAPPLYVNSALVMPLLVNADNPLMSEPKELIPLAELLPESLATIKEAGCLADRRAAEALCDMLEAAHIDGVTNWQITDAYRSYQTQREIWDETYKKYREVNELSESKALQATRRRVAEPGTSEHHTGLAFDMGVAGESFRKTEQCAWLAENCVDYGFVIRYTQEKEAITGITEEPWHIRYVGVEHAHAMTKENLCLEEYVALYGDSI